MIVLESDMSVLEAAKKLIAEGILCAPVKGKVTLCWVSQGLCPPHHEVFFYHLRLFR